MPGGRLRWHNAKRKQLPPNYGVRNGLDALKSGFQPRLPMRSESLQSLAQITACVGILLTILGGYGAHYFGKAIEQTRTHEAAQQEEKITALSAEAQQATAASAELQKRLGPFEHTARELFPNLAEEPALASLHEEIKELKTRRSPRELSAPQREAVLVALRKFPRREMDITVVKNDPEAWQFAEQLKSTIEAGGWAVTSMTVGEFSVPIHGIFVSVRQTPAPEVAGELVGALEAAGIVPNGNVDPRQRSDRVNLVVATKE